MTPKVQVAKITACSLFHLQQDKQFTIDFMQSWKWFKVYAEFVIFIENNLGFNVIYVVRFQCRFTLLLWYLTNLFIKFYIYVYLAFEVKSSTVILLAFNQIKITSSVRWNVFQNLIKCFCIIVAHLTMGMKVYHILFDTDYKF